ncbi:hypothetical protein RND71_035423 [Anisodus tanguticus]|uniref:Uncharacterized protein n=1 Tax=Anisodus tanguticus TaxID=243964 RepID=A0AAE1UVU2_9SOLA|nr:hypothetical protein RND71_035423 [Anisodus tanguticus]
MVQLQNDSSLPSDPTQDRPVPPSTSDPTTPKAQTGFNPSRIATLWVCIGKPRSGVIARKPHNKPRAMSFNPEGKSPAVIGKGLDTLVIGIIRRKAMIKDLAAIYHAECLAYCQELLELQKKVEESLIDMKTAEDSRRETMRPPKHDAFLELFESDSLVPDSAMDSMHMLQTVLCGWNRHVESSFNRIAYSHTATLF